MVYPDLYFVHLYREVIQQAVKQYDLYLEIARFPPKVAQKYLSPERICVEHTQWCPIVFNYVFIVGIGKVNDNLKIKLLG